MQETTLMHAPRDMAPIQSGARIYRATGFWKYALLSLSVITIGGSSAGMLFFFNQHHSLFTQEGLAIGCISLLFTLLGIYILLWVTTFRLELSPNQIVITGFLQGKTIALSDLRGWRVRPTSPPTLVLEYKQKDRRSQKITLVFLIDEVMEGWFGQIPELDQKAKDVSLAEALDNPDLGFTESERIDGLNAARKCARIANIFASAICAWALFVPRPYTLLMLALCILPLAAATLVRSSKGVIRIDEFPNDAHPNVSSAYLFPLLLLLLRTILDFDVLLSKNLLISSLLISAGLCVLTFWADLRMRKSLKSFAVLCVFSLGYGYGATVQINSLQERYPAQLFTTTVNKKYITNGKHVSYNVELQAWGPRTEPNTLELPKSTYERVQINTPAKIVLRTGWLGIQWYYLRLS